MATFGALCAWPSLGVDVGRGDLGIRKAAACVGVFFEDNARGASWEFSMEAVTLEGVTGVGPVEEVEGVMSRPLDARRLVDSAIVMMIR